MEYRQVKVKITASETTEQLEELINEFISEIDECEVKDIKFMGTESAGCDWLYAMILYY
jgi:hypothetical protein